MSWLANDENPEFPFILKRSIFADERGSLEMIFEIEKIVQKTGISTILSQVNLIAGRKNSLRGFHASPAIYNHWKFVTCVKGVVRDAVLDVRRDSQTFGRYEAIELSGNDRATLVIPPGFAHGVQSLTENSLTIYATNIPYRLNAEFEINPIGHHFEKLWTDSPILSERDLNAPSWEEFAGE
jgi:dTDP-4-dehydrorhamnose 3,5-epimerase